MGKKNEVREIWKDVVGYEGLYQVSSLGRVKNLSSKREPTYGAKHDKGYLRVTLKKAGEKDTSPLVHQLVAKAFIPNPDCKPTVDHINEDKKDNRVENLRWATYSENQLNSVESRSSVREKLSPKQVESIWRDFLFRGISKKQIAKRLNRDLITISYILNGRTYLKESSLAKKVLGIPVTTLNSPDEGSLKEVI